MVNDSDDSGLKHGIWYEQEAQSGPLWTSDDSSYYNSTAIVDLGVDEVEPGVLTGRSRLKWPRGYGRGPFQGCVN